MFFITGAIVLTKLNPRPPPPKHSFTLIFLHTIEAGFAPKPEHQQNIESTKDVGRKNQPISETLFWSGSFFKYLRLLRRFSAVYVDPTKAEALFLTPLIKENKIEEARVASTVNKDGFLNVTSYSGFLTVDPKYNSNLFFWYFPVQNKEVSKTPWIIWLQGGPGATSLAGLFVEMGPFEFNGMSLSKRNSSWCDEYSMVFIDNPVGAGYSFTDSDEGFVQNMETLSENLYSAVKQLTLVYPELGVAPLYVAGESYAGHHVPALATKISKGTKNGDNSINLQGIMLGNPVIDRLSIVDLTSVFYNWGLVDAQGALSAKPLQKQYEEAILKEDIEKAYELRDMLFDRLQNIASKQQIFNVLKDVVVNGFVPFLSFTGVIEALHVGDIKFTFSNGTVHEKLKPDFLVSTSPMIEELLEHYRVLIYCGQLDLTTPCVLNAEARRKNWRWSGRDNFLFAPRDPWLFEDVVAGYVKSGGGLTEILVMGAGHLVPIDKPAAAKQLITNFIEKEDFPMPGNYERKLKFTPAYQEYTDVKTSDILSENLTMKAGLITSVVVNVLLLIGIIVGALLFRRLKNQNDYLNLPLDDNILSLDLA